ncbi:hypothetical protein STRCI_008362 [Streptomyces cinnabarinus]|uniref:Uncharacterized protein n=1 Tax=Streptomyces cinnabarinus TaxID=67287 RepID=A0ABY7KV38_9ACTN|nr:hypothetical protein [Streptomyces cinnabarinus]WAZ26734.1 hypothetical protein STRCI_008362 [Streptomyces cinnabarinus]
MITLSAGMGPVRRGGTVKLYLAVTLVPLALLIAASGVAAVTSGWVLPMTRHHVRTPRIYGWGQLVVAFALCWQLVFGLMISDSDARPSGTLIGAAILLAGLIVMMVGQLAGGNRKGGGGTP